MSTLLSLLHSILRNFIIYFGPIVIIGATLILNLPNPQIYKDSFRANNLYGQLSAEMRKLEPAKTQPGNILEQVGSSAYDTFFWSVIGKNLASQEWLQNLTETNLDRIGVWLRADSDNLSIFLPQDQINQAVQEEALKSIRQSNPQLQAIQDTAGQAWKEFLNRGSQLSEAAGNAFNDFCKNNPGQDVCKPRFDAQGLNPGQQISRYTDDLTNLASPWFTPLRTLRNAFIFVQNIAWIVLIVYSLLLLTLALVSPWFGKKRLSESATIALKLGLNTLAGTMSILAGLSALFLSGVLLRQFLVPALQQPQILTILGWQGVWTSLAIFSPALFSSIALILFGLFVNNMAKSQRVAAERQAFPDTQTQTQRSSYNHDNLRNGLNNQNLARTNSSSSLFDQDS